MKHKRVLLAVLAGWLIAGFLPPQQLMGKLRGGKGGS